MASLLQRLTGREVRDITSIEDYVQALNQYTLTQQLQTTLGGGPTESVGASLVGYAQGAYKSNGIVFSCMAVRQLVFSSVRFRWQRLRDGKPSDLFGTPDLRVLERPAPGETTQGMLSRMIQDADLAGNAYNVLDTPLTRLGGDITSGTEVVRLRPDWVEIVLAPRMRPFGQLGWHRVGYIYTEGGKYSGNKPVPLLVDEVSHFAPHPDPLASFVGISWLTPVVREIESDLTMTRHKRRFFDNGATPNMIIKHPVGADRNKILDFQKRLQADNAGSENAYKTLNLYPGADATVVGANMEQIDFKAVQGAGETRIAAAAGVPPVIAGFSEGLESATYSNYGQARRRFADGTMHPLWADVSGSLAPLLRDPGPDSRLWYDADDVPFLREDEKDAAEINQVRASTITSLVNAGFTHESAVKAVETGDFRLLKHTGLFSVQLQKPGADDPAPVRALEPALELREERAVSETHVHLPASTTNLRVEGAQVHVPEQPAPDVRVDVTTPTPEVHVDVAAAAAPEVRVENAISVEPTPIEVRNEVEAPNIVVEQPDITVEPPNVYVEAPEVRVEAPQVDVTVEAPEVTVEAPNVTVEARAEVPAPEIRVDVAPTPVTVANQVDVQPAEVVVKGPKRTKVERDAKGEISGTTYEYEEE